MSKCIFDYMTKGYVIYFQTRDLTDVEATVIWQKLSPIRIKESIEETGHCLLIFNSFAVNIKKGKGKNIIIECGRNIDD